MKKTKLKYRISILERQVKELKASIRRLNNNIYKEPKIKDTCELKSLKDHLCKYLGIDQYKIEIKSKEREFVNYRHAFIYKALRLEKYFSYEEIGKPIGMKEQGVYHAVKNLTLRMNGIPEFNDLITDIKDIKFN
jgi:chromosomal replication initiation ATPase DnaA